MSMNLFTPSTANTVALSVSGTTASSALADTSSGGGSRSVRIYNAAAVTVFIQFGGSTVTATTSHMPIPSGAVETFEVGSATYIAGITAGTSGTLYVTSGRGA